MKRGVSSIGEYVELRNLLDFVLKAKSKSQEPANQVRDRALLAALALTGMRVSEVLSIRRGQIKVGAPGGFVEIQNVRILKRRNSHILKDFALPRDGILEPLTELFLEYVRRYKYPETRVFDISRQRAWQIVNEMTGKWCHYFRSQRISYLVNKIRSTVAVADMLGIRKSDTIGHYYKGGWRQYQNELAPQ